MKKINGNTIKITAMLAMLADHIGVVILGVPMKAQGISQAFSPSIMQQGFAALGNTYLVYCILRAIGRIAFPMFAFLLVEGFLHTKNVKRYIQRLLLTGFLAEIPFDLADAGVVYNPSYQNVFFTLAIGLLVLCGIRFFMESGRLHGIFNISEKKEPAIRLTGAVITFVAGCLAAELIQCDYSAAGIICITIVYVTRSRGPVKALLFSTIAEALMNPTAIFAPLACLPVAAYSGKQGHKSRLLQTAFYLFYPAHLLLLWLITLFM